MLQVFRLRIGKPLARVLVIVFFFQLFSPFLPKAYALTSGPTQPEVQSFEPVGTTDMVDLFTGDFTYNIPLLELPGPNGGYPFNLHYNAGIGMDQEASWCGTGWNVSPGAINRQMRGLPDDFSGDQMSRTYDMKPNITVGLNGSVGPNVEIFGGDLGLKNLKQQLSLGLGVYYNNYRGMGYSIDAGLNISANVYKDKLNAGVGLNLSIDSQEGIGVNSSLALTAIGDEIHTKFTLGSSYNSLMGLKGISLGANILTNHARTVGIIKAKSAEQGIGGSSMLSFAANSYSPQVSMPMQGSNGTVSVKFGGDFKGFFANAQLGGFYNEQHVRTRNATSKAFGYMYMEGAGEGDLRDFNREKDGTVYKSSPNLAAPSLTYDIYSVTGQGISAMYRPYRSDIGVVHDQLMESKTAGGSLGVEFGGGSDFHFGLDASVNLSTTTSGKWIQDNDLQEKYPFLARSTGETQAKTVLYEPYYFKTHGEPTTDPLDVLDHIGNDDAVQIPLAKNGPAIMPRKVFTARPILKKSNGNEKEATTFGETYSRKSRNTAILPITNEVLTGGQSSSTQHTEVLREYQVDYYTAPTAASSASSTTQPLIRNRNPKHIAGFTATNPDGARYVYGLPAYNTKQVECQFSVDARDATEATRTIDIAKNGNSVNYKVKGTDQYYNKTEMPPYVHAYMLTNILGADYVDADNIPGPSEGDLGYWVKFTYTKTSSGYQWRAPFTGASYMRGYNTIPSDDKASYTYGEKEIWYLSHGNRL